MWIRSLVLMSFPMILLIGSALVPSDIQGGGEEEPPSPTATYPPNLISPAFSLTPTAPYRHVRWWVSIKSCG